MVLGATATLFAPTPIGTVTLLDTFNVVLDTNKSPPAPPPSPRGTLNPRLEEALPPGPARI